MAEHAAQGCRTGRRAALRSAGYASVGLPCPLGSVPWFPWQHALSHRETHFHIPTPTPTHPQHMPSGERLTLVACSVRRGQDTVAAHWSQAARLACRARQHRGHVQMRGSQSLQPQVWLNRLLRFKIRCASTAGSRHAAHATMTAAQRLVHQAGSRQQALQAQAACVPAPAGQALTSSQLCLLCFLVDSQFLRGQAREVKAG